MITHGKYDIHRELGSWNRCLLDMCSAGCTRSLHSFTFALMAYYHHLNKISGDPKALPVIFRAI